jgi:hypothetical protein
MVNMQTSPVIVMLLVTVMFYVRHSSFVVCNIESCIELVVFSKEIDDQKELAGAATPDVMKTDDVFIPVSHFA